MRLRERLVRALRRLFRRRKRWHEIDMTRLKREFLADICADGDFAAAVVGRPDVRVKEVTA